MDFWVRLLQNVHIVVSGIFELSVSLPEIKEVMQKIFGDYKDIEVEDTDQHMVIAKMLIR